MVTHKQYTGKQLQTPINHQVFAGVNATLSLLKQGWDNLVSFTQNSEKYMELLENVESLKAQNSQVILKINGSEKRYTSKITAVNAGHRTVVIDSIATESSDSTLLPGQELCIEAVNNGQTITIPCHFIDDLVPNMQLGYQLKLADRVNH